MDSNMDLPFVVGKDGHKHVLSDNIDKVVGQSLVVHQWTNDGVTADSNYWLITHKQVGTCLAWALSKYEAIQIASNLKKSRLDLYLLARGGANNLMLEVMYDAIAGHGGTWRDGIMVIIEKISFSDDFLDRKLNAKT